MNKENNSKIKDYYNQLKEAWKIPYKRAGIKLMGYLLLFIIIFLLASITSRIDNNKKTYDSDKTTIIVQENKYLDKLNNLITKKQNISYIIYLGNVEYKINGIINNNIIDGYIEYNDEIKKIIIEANSINELKNNEKKELDLGINLELINLSSIVKTIKEKSSIIERIDDNTINYIYNLNINNKDCIIKVYSNEDMIYKIDINSETDKYILNFDN